MNSHFDRYLNVRDLIRERRPRLIVECGAGSGENTAKILTLRPELGFRLVVINDGRPEGIEFDGAEWILGLSYLEIPKFEDGSIDFCLIDTDHNYWTLKTELDALRPKMPTGGVVCLHDTVTFAHSSGKMNGYYRVNAPYPTEQIEAAERQGKSLKAAIEESLDAYRVIRESEESHGAMALERL